MSTDFSLKTSMEIEIYCGMAYSVQISVYLFSNSYMSRDEDSLLFFCGLLWIVFLAATSRLQTESACCHAPDRTVLL